MCDLLGMKKKTSHCLSKFVATFIASTLLGLSSLSAAPAGKTPISYEKALNDAVKVAGMKKSWSVMRGAGNSMVPFYGENSVLVVEKASFAKLSAGMVAVYKDSKGTLVAHPLTARTDSGWLAQGINNRGQDPERVNEENFVGVVFGVFNASEGWQESSAKYSAEQIPLVYGKTF